jgi:hypothetical protein
VQDRRFDDNQISNMYLKLKWETVGRFSFDFRPMDGDESYMVVNNTLRIFWGDLHKLDGVIQRVDWDATQWCYHIYGADIRGLLLERVNTEPATVHSYTSDVQTQVMFNGCDFPTNVWTGSGDAIGKYTFKYRVGLQNTVRIMGATRRWESVTERGTVYEHQNGCLYDATKNWVPQEYAGATLRFVSGACKNNVYNINGNSSNKVCIRLPGEPATAYATGANVPPPTIIIEGATCGLAVSDWSFENGYPDTIPLNDTSGLGTGFMGTYPVEDGSWYRLGWYPDMTNMYATAEWLPSEIYGDIMAHCQSGWFTEYYGHDISYSALLFGHRQTWGTPWDFPSNGTISTSVNIRGAGTDVKGLTVEVWLYDSSGNSLKFLQDVTFATEWTVFNAVEECPNLSIFSDVVRVDVFLDYLAMGMGNVDASVDLDDIIIYIQGCPGVIPWGVANGTIPGCSSIGDIYEIVTHKMVEVQPPSVAPATLQQDNHIIQYNTVNDQSDHTTSMTVRGSV